MLDKIYEFLTKGLYYVCGGFMVEENSLGLSIVDGVKISTSGSWGTIWSAMTNIADNVFVPIASTIVCIMFFAAIIEKSSTEKITGEQLIREIIKLVMGLWLVKNCTFIMTQCINLGNGFITRVSNRIGGIASESTIEAFAQKMSGSDLITNLLKAFNPLTGMLFSCVILISVLILAIIIVCLLVICQVRKAEIMLKTAVAPLAMFDTFSGSFLNSHAVNFIRSFLATCLQGVFITIAVNIIPLFGMSVVTSLITATDLWAVTKDVLMLLVVYISVLVLTFKSGSFAKEIMGAR